LFAIMNDSINNIKYGHVKNIVCAMFNVMHGNVVRRQSGTAVYRKQWGAGLPCLFCIGWNMV